MANSGQIKSDFNLSNVYNYRLYWYFDWTSTKSAYGKTTINWTLSTMRGSDTVNDSADEFYSYIRLRINGTDQTLSEGNYTDYMMFPFKKNVKTEIFHGSFIVEHDENGAANFTAQIAGRIYRGGGRTITGSATTTFELDENFHRTPCTAPSNVKVAIGDKKSPKYIIPQSTTFTISWSAGEDGKHNPITGYRIYYYIIEENDLNAKYSGSTDVALNVYETKITLSNTETELIRKNQINFCVRTKGDVNDGSLWSKRTYADAIFVNTLPNAPAINVDNVIPSAETSATFTIGSITDDDDQELSVYYASVYNTKNATIIEGSSIDLKIMCDEGEASTYYFWTFDGLEYSAATEKKVYKNIKPDASIELESVEATTDFPMPENLAYVFSQNITIDASEKITQNTKESKFYYSLHWENDVAKDTIELGPFDSNTIQNNDVRQNIGFENLPCSYYISAYYNDGYEDSNPVKSETFYLTGLPSVTIKRKTDETEEDFVDFDKLFHTKNAALEDLTPFGTNLYFTFGEDSGYNSYKIKYDGIEKIISNGQSVIFNSVNILTQRIITVEIGYNGNNFMKKAETYKYIQVITPTIENLVSLSFDNLIEAYKLTSSYLFNFDSKELNTSFLNYGFTDIPKIICAFLASDNSNIGSIMTGECHGSSDANNFIFTLTGASIWEGLGGTSTNLNKNSASNQIKFQASMTNIFGNIASQAIDMTISYAESPAINDVFICSLHGDKKIDIKNWLYLKETQKIKTYLSFSSYNSNPIVVVSRLKENGQWEEQEQRFTLPESFIPSPGNPAVYECTFEWEINEVLVDYNTEFKITINTAAGISVTNEDATYKNIPVAAHRNTSIALTKAEYSSNNLDISWEIGDGGSTKTFDSFEIELKNITTSTSQTVSSSLNDIPTNDSATLSYNNGNEDIFNNGDTAQITLNLITYLSAYYEEDGNIVSGGYTTTKSTAVPSVRLVYNILPTVSYRKNHIGINTIDFGSHSDSAIVIGAYNDKDKISLIGVVDNETRISEINLSTGGLINFIIDCGTWDENLTS